MLKTVLKSILGVFSVLWFAMVLIVSPPTSILEWAGLLLIYAVIITATYWFWYLVISALIRAMHRTK